MIVKNCLRCGKEFSTRFLTAKYCSKKCYWNSTFRNCLICNKRFKVPSSNLKKGMGKFCSMKCSGKWQSMTRVGSNHLGWKGDDVGYDGLHKWVRKHLGKPTKCEHCGKDGLTGKQIHWANKDHSYKRNLTDWIALCSMCHKEYDIEYNGVSRLPWCAGKKLSEEHKKKLSESHKGLIPWNKGLKLTN